ncbi:MAG: CrcB family protein [Sphingomonadales bacterium]|nr:CrcB family protein [Sphingomonadales bacterium]
MVLRAGFAMGLLVGWLARHGQGGEGWRLFLGIGLLGGFTTFSAFSLEIVNMVERGAIGLAALYALASVLGAVAALLAGLWIVRIAA